jgi:flagellin
MSRINTNVSSLIAQRVLRKNNNSLSLSLERLSTGLRINRGADNPAGLIASENLRAEKAGINQAISNAERASNVIGTAEGGLSEVSSLLNELQGLVNQSASTGGLTPAETDANQIQVDSILNTINRLAGSTAFQGLKLLNGNFSYTTSGVTSTNFGTVQVNSARLPDNAPVDVVVAVTASAQTAKIGYAGGALSATNNVTIEIAGNKGTEQLSFAGGTTVAQMITAINSLKDSTGVSAAASAANLALNSIEYGATQFVTLSTISGGFAPTSSTDSGRDASVTVNGGAAQVDGLNVVYRSAGLDIELGLKAAFNVVGSDDFFITGGGAVFAMGSKVTENDKASIGIQSVTTGSLGNATIGFLSTLGSGKTNSLTSGNLVTAQKILDKATQQVAQLRGRLGAFERFTIGSTINSLGVALENVTAADSAIRDTDFAQETANLTRAQILSQAATTVLAQANSSPQLALSLLRGQ